MLKMIFSITCKCISNASQTPGNEEPILSPPGWNLFKLNLTLWLIATHFDFVFS